MNNFHYILWPLVFAIVLAALLYRRWAGRSGYFKVNSQRPHAVAFQQDIEDGLSSSHFDLSANVKDGDARPGLDGDEVRHIMADEGCSFDEARLRRQQRLLLRNNIDPDTGLPRDAKLVTFS